VGIRVRILLAALVAGAFALAWWLVASAPGPAGAALPDAAAPAAPAGAASTPVAATTGGAVGRSLAAGAGAPPAPGDATVEVVVVVIDELERPLAGARVRLPEGAPGGESAPAGEWTSDADGRVRLPVRSRADPQAAPGRDGGSYLRLAVDKPGYFHADRTKRLRPEVFVLLRRAIPLGGFVVDRDTGDPVAGARLSFEHRDCVACAPETAVSDGAGHYRFEAVPAGARLDLLVEAEGYVAGRASFRTTAEALEAVHDAVLGRGLPVAVTVLDAETRTPLEGAQVSGEKGPFETDAVGRVESDQLVAVDEPRARLKISAPGYCRLTLRPSVGAVAETPELVVPLVRAATVEGRVVDALGQPASGVELTWDAGFEWEPGTADGPLATWLADLPRWSLGRGGDAAPPVFRSDDVGRFTLDGALPWTPAFTLNASAPDGARGSVELTLPGPGEAAQVLVELHHEALATDTATIRGRFTLNGEPEKGSVLWRGATRSGSARPDERGAFVLAGVEPGTVALAARSDRLLARSTCALADMGPFPVYVAPGAQLERDLALALPFAAIEGRVSDASGAPLADLPVEAEDPDRCWRERARTDSEGRYRLEVPADLPAFEVAVERSPERLARADVAPGAGGVDFVLSPLGRLRFRALDESEGTPVARGKLDWRRAGSPFGELADFGRLVPDPAGWYEVDCPAGTLDLSMRTSRESHVPQQMRGVAVFEGETTSVEFSLRRSLTRRFVLDADSIAPPKGFAAVVLPASLWSKARFSPTPRPHWEGVGKGSPADELHFKPSGSARARGLKPGAYRIKVWPETLRITPDRLQLEADRSEATVRVRLDWR